jgi:hypothetical protein
MTVSEMGKLAARHMRFQRELLALWRHTCRAWEAMRADDWAAWVAERQRLVAAVAAQEGARLAADTAAASADAEPRFASRLVAFHELEVGTMAAIVRLDGRVRDAARGRLAALSGRLRARRKAQAARREYGGRARAMGRLSRRG